MAKTVLVRLLVGLVGYGTTTLIFPFLPLHIWCAGGPSGVAGKAVAAPHCRRLRLQMVAERSAERPAPRAVLRRALLGSVMALGVFHGIAFSASYQLVARFANKNVIALGLGNSASGPLVLVLQLLVGMAADPTHRQTVRACVCSGVDGCGWEWEWGWGG